MNVSVSRVLTATAVLLAVFTVPLSIPGAAIALADITTQLGPSPFGQQWALNGFNVTFAASTLAWGAFADATSHRRALTLACLIFIGASALSFAAPNYLLLDAARIAAGTGAGAVFSVGTALLSQSFDGSMRDRLFALMGATAGLSLAGGPTVCGLLVQHLGWRYVFGFQGVLLALAVALLLCAGRIPSERAERTAVSFDWAAAAAYCGLIAALVSALVFASTGDWFAYPVLVAVGVAALCLVGLILRERHASSPLLDVSLIAQPRFLGVSLVVVVASFSFATLVTYMPSLLQAAYGFSPASSGLFAMFMTVPTLAAPLVAGVLVARGSAPHVVLLTALLLMVVGCAGVALTVGLPVVGIAPFMVLLGAGFGFHAGLVDNQVLAAVSTEQSGMAAGWVNTLRLGSEALAVSLFGAVFIPSLTAAEPIAAFRGVGLVSAVISLAVAVVSARAMLRH